MEKQLQRIKAKAAKLGLSQLPRVSKEEVAAFEKRNKLQLPKEYTAVITHTGGNWTQQSLKSLENKMSLLKKEFPFTTAWVWEDEPNTKHDDPRFASLAYGNVQIQDNGCGSTTHLIITGQEKGQVWEFTGEGITPFSPRKTFLDWYEERLDESLKQPESVTTPSTTSSFKDLFKRKPVSPAERRYYLRWLVVGLGLLLLSALLRG